MTLQVSTLPTLTPLIGPKASPAADPPKPAPAAKPQAPCQNPGDLCRVDAGEAPKAKGALAFVEPDCNKPTHDFFINGIRTPEANAKETVQGLEAKTKSHIQLIYNPTQGLVPDALEAVANLTGIDTGISRQAQAQFKQALDKGEKIRVFAHSQGAAITADALREIAAGWRREGLSPKQIEQKLHQVEVVGFGGFALENSFPKGVKVELFRHTEDYIPKFADAIYGLQKAASSKENDFMDALGKACGTVGGFVVSNSFKAIGFSVDKAIRNMAGGKQGQIDQDMSKYMASLSCAVESDHLMLVKDQYTRDHVNAGYLAEYHPDQPAGRPTAHIG